jgi:hypothetical protein
MTISTFGKTLTLDQQIAAIEALDLEPIKFKTRRREDGYGWTQAHADDVAAAYKRYLMLCAQYPDQTIAPDHDTDRFWHMHILDTRKYAADCEQVFGYFLHHFPYLGLRGADDAKALEDAFARTQALSAAAFGVQLHGAEPAWCAAEQRAQGPAWCAAEALPRGAAWCAAESPAQKAAWCAADATPDALPDVKPAWCAAERPAQASA